MKINQNTFVNKFIKIHSFLVKANKNNFVDLAFRLNAFPTRWWARFLFENLIFYWLFENDLESPLIFVLFLKGKQNKKGKP